MRDANALAPGRIEVHAVEDGGVRVDIDGVMEQSGIDVFAVMCSQQSILGSLWFATGEAQEMSGLASCGAFDMSVLENHVFPLREDQRSEGLPARRGGFTNFIVTLDPASSASEHRTTDPSNSIP